MRLTVALLIGCLSSLSMIVYLSYQWLVMALNAEVCAEYCFPNSCDMMNVTTCACWNDDKIEIVDIKDIE